MMHVHASTPHPTTLKDGHLRAKAEELEAAFLAEMLRHAGMGAQGGGFGGGAGEEQFVSFLREAQAKAMVHAGGIGLAERLFRALSEGAQ